MSITRSRTKIHGKEKIKLIFEYGLDDIQMYVAYGGSVSIRPVKTEGMSNYDVSEFLLKVFYTLIEIDIADIEERLYIKITNDGITRDGEYIKIVYIQ